MHLFSRQSLLKILKIRIKPNNQREIDREHTSDLDGSTLKKQSLDVLLFTSVMPTELYLHSNEYILLPEQNLFGGKDITPQSGRPEYTRLTNYCVLTNNDEHVLMRCKYFHSLHLENFIKQNTMSIWLLFFNI